MTIAEQLAVDGYVTIDLFDDDTVAQLSKQFDALEVPEDVPFLASCNDLARETAGKVDRELKNAVAPVVEQLIPEHDIFLAGFICKGAKVGGEVDFHQDLTYTDERRHRSVLLWVPLVDVDETNGALHVVPGSHRWTTGIRVGGMDTLPTNARQDEFRQRAVTLPLRAGQAVVYDAALVHGSGANGTDAVRPAVAIATAPAGADLLHFHSVAGAVRGYAIDESYFTLQSLRTQPQGYPEIEPWTEPVDESSFDVALGLVAVRTSSNDADEAPEEGTKAPGRPSRSDASAEEPLTLRTVPSTDGGRRPLLTTRHARGLSPMSPRQALRDEALDLRLRRDGFVKFPLIDRSSASALKEQYGRVHGWEGSGFEPDLTNSDVEYRRKVSELLGGALDSVVTSHFAGFSPYLRNFLCKWPGADSSLYLHRDWMYIDERKGDRSYVVWIPLQDVTGGEGQIQVLRHSHRVDSMLRGTDLNAPWIQHEEAIRERLLTVPVHAGEALVMDNALVHCSLPNNTTEPRVVAAIGVRPVESPLVHFRRTGDTTADRYDVDGDFFLTATPQALMASPPDLPVAEASVPVRDDALDASELVKRLNSSPLTVVDNVSRRLAKFRSR